MIKTLIITAVILLFLPLSAGARTWHVPEEVPTIQGGIDLAHPGDDVLVAPGEYFEYDIVLKGGITIHTEQGPEVTIVNPEGRGRGFFGSYLDEMVTLEGFTIRNGVSEGYAGGVGVFRSSLAIRNCIISGCEAAMGGGIGAQGSTLEVSDCQVRFCFATGGGGIYLEVSDVGSITGCEVVGNIAGMGPGGGIVAGGITSTMTIADCVISENVAIDGVGGGLACLSPGLLIRDCLITRNITDGWWGGAGIYVEDSLGEILRCTISHNIGNHADGILVASATLDIENTIISFNGGRGVVCGSTVTFRCNDLYANADGDDICGTDLGGNFSANPLFCDSQNTDYSLDASSPCLPGNHPNGDDCGLIGARDVGCGAVRVEKRTWGQLKAGFR